jgi:hypothetical protein
MTLIRPQRLLQRGVLNIRVDARFLAVLKAYAECISSTHDYIVQEAVLRMFVADRDFREWLEERQPEAVKALDDLVADRPARQNRPSRTPGTPATSEVAR